jgi:DNA end-binding protein Ku
MQQLLYANEVRSFRDIDVPRMDVKEAELKLAKQLIEQQSSSRFNPAEYKDDVKERIEKAIQKKVEGEEITMSEEPTTGGAQVIDLMEALRASLEKKGGAAGKAAKTTTRKPAKRAAAAESAPARRRAKK